MAELPPIYVSLELRPALAKDQQTALIGDCCDNFSEFISTGMMSGVMSWTTANVGGQGLVCGIARSMPTGLGSWNDSGTAVSDNRERRQLLLGEDGNFRPPNFTAPTTYLRSRARKGGGYVNWVYDPSSDSIVRDENATMVYYPRGFIPHCRAATGKSSISNTMLVVGVLMLASGWGSALGAAVTGEFLTAAADGVMNAAFTLQMTEPLLANEHISGGPLSYFGASRRIFYFGDNFWVRNADDTHVEYPHLRTNRMYFEAAETRQFHPADETCRVDLNYLPLTYYTNDAKTALGTYLFDSAMAMCDATTQANMRRDGLQRYRLSRPDRFRLDGRHAGIDARQRALAKHHL